MATLNNIKALIVEHLDNEIVDEEAEDPEFLSADDLGGSIINLRVANSDGETGVSFDIHIIQRG